MSIYVGNKKIYPDGYGGQDFWAVPYGMTTANSSSGNSLYLSLCTKACDSIDGVSVGGHTLTFDSSSEKWGIGGAIEVGEMHQFVITYTLNGEQFTYESPFALVISGAYQTGFTISFVNLDE